MANDLTTETAHDPTTADPPLVPADDPGGAHAKGYTADPTPGVKVPDDTPIPLADPPPGAAIIQPEWSGKVQPNGVKEPGDYTPNDRLLGADR
jgi:hypothetical protein